MANLRSRPAPRSTRTYTCGTPGWRAGVAADCHSRLLAWASWRSPPSFTNATRPHAPSIATSVVVPFAWPPPRVHRHPPHPARAHVAHEPVRLAVGVARHEVRRGGDERHAVRRVVGVTVERRPPRIAVPGAAHAAAHDLHRPDPPRRSLLGVRLVARDHEHVGEPVPVARHDVAGVGLVRHVARAALVVRDRRIARRAVRHAVRRRAREQERGSVGRLLRGRRRGGRRSECGQQQKGENASHRGVNPPT